MRATIVIRSCWCAWLTLALAGASHAAPMLYTLSDLGDLPGGLNSSSAWGINNVGQVTGNGSNASSNTRAFLWSPTTPNGTAGSMVDLGSLSGAGSQGFAANGFGQVAGWSSTSTLSHAMVWTPTTPNGTVGSMADMGMLPGTGSGSRAEAINVSGQVAGWSYVNGVNEHRGFLWTPDAPNTNSGAMIDLGDFAGGTNKSQAFGVNDYGQVVGTSNSGMGDRAFLWQPTTPNGQVGAMVPITGLPGGNAAATATAINASGQVALSGVVGNVWRVYRWTPTTPNGTIGVAVDLGSISSHMFSQGINADGTVVGYGDSSGVRMGFVWTPADGMRHLNTVIDGGLPSGVDLREARAINDAGQIVGVASFGTALHAFLLTPVPEPSGMAAFAVIAIAATRPFRRQRRAQ